MMKKQIAMLLATGAMLGAWGRTGYGPGVSSNTIVSVTAGQTLVAQWKGYEYDSAGFAIYDGWLLDYNDKNATSLAVPEGVVGIGAEALAGMWDLQTVILPQSLKHIAEGAFRDDGYLDNLVIPDSVETIGDRAFEDCSYLQTLTIGKGVKSVGARAFAGCTQLQKVSFEEGMETIGGCAFSNCWRMASVSLPLSTSNVVWTAFAQCRSLVGVRMPTHMAPLSDWFAPVTEQIRDVTIPAGETGIGYGAFEGCSSLRSVVFERREGATVTNGVLWIDGRAFCGCKALEGIELPESLQHIGSEAFRDCTALKALALPQSVSWLGDSAFRGCSALNSLTLSKSLTSLSDYVFYGCDALDSFTVPESVTYLGRQFASGSNRWCGPSAIYYLGNAPSYDAEAYAGTRGELTSYVVLGTRGWDGRASSRDIPAEWPVDNANAREIKTWSPNPFDVTFDANGGVFINDGSTAYACEQISYTAYALPPYNPKRDQGIFDGWWTEPVGGAKVTSSTLVTLTKAHTLYAHWIVGGRVRVRFNATGGTVAPEVGDYTTGVPFGELPVPTREYWDFDGWWTEASYGTQITAASEVPAADVELFAHWVPARYTIVYHSENGYYGSTRTQTFTYGETVTLYRNYWSCGSATFGGWATEPGGPAVYADEKTLTEISDVRDGEIHLYAVWIGDSYSVRFDSNGGVGRMDNQTMMMGVTYALNTNCYARSGYTFKGWSLASSGSVKYKDAARVSDLSSVKNDTVVLYAVWEALKTYTVTFKPNGGTCSESVRYVVGGTKIGELPVPTRSGYTFRCWTSGSSGGTVITPETVINSSRTYYAQWDKNVVSTEKHVTFDATGGTSPETSRTVTAGNAIGTLPTPTRNKYKFCGWYTAKDGGTKISATTKVTADVTYYAHWEEEPCYTCLIHFDANGGLCNVTNRTVFGGGTVGSLPSAARWGWRFLGWFTAPWDGEEISDDTVVEDNAYFYAHWEELDVETYELGKMYGTADSGSEQVDLTTILAYAQSTHLPIVLLIGGKECSPCESVHQAFLDSGRWDVPCLLYYDYYQGWHGSECWHNNGVVQLLGNRVDNGWSVPALYFYWDLGDGMSVYKCQQLRDSVYTWIGRTGKTINKEAIQDLIVETLSDPYAIAVDGTETFIPDLPSVREIVLDIDAAAEKDGSVNIRLDVYANSAEMPKIAVSGLPSGVKFDANTMTISGKVAKPGCYSFTVKTTMETTNATETRTFTFTVPNFTTEMFTAAGLKTDKDYDLWLGVPPAIGDVFTTITRAGWKLSVSELPPGITFDAKNNSLKGVATKYGSYTVTFTATKGAEKQVATATFGVSFPEVCVDVETWYDSDSDEYDDWDEYADGVVSGEGFYQPGKKVTLKATPAKGSVFVGWYLDGWWGDDEDTLLSKETTYSWVMTENDLCLAAVFATTVQDARSLKVAVADATTAVDGAFSLDLGACVTSLSQPKLTVSGLPSGVKYDAKTMMISGKATKPGVYTVKVTATNASVTGKDAVVKGFTITVPNFTTEMFEAAGLDTEGKYVLTAGVVPAVAGRPPYRGINEVVATVVEGGWKLAVTGLPAGLKYDAKNNKITGVATKEGFYTVTFTATKGSGKTAEKQIATATFEVVFPTLTLQMAAWDVASATNKCKVAGGGRYPFGKKVTLKATPAKGSVFVGWRETVNSEEGIGNSDGNLSQAASYAYVTTDEDVTLTAVFATEAEDVASLTVEVEDVTTAADGTVGTLGEDGKYALDLSTCMTSLSQPKLAVSGLPTGVKYDAKTMKITGKATKPGGYTVKVAATNTSVKKATDASTATFKITVPNFTCDALPNLRPETDAYGIVQCGVLFDPDRIKCTPANGWTVKVAGLPTGLKYDAKTGKITGVPTAKAGSYTVTFTASKKGEANQVATITLNVEALPDWVVGTFNGDMMWVTDAFGGSSQYHDIVSTFTVSSAGKLSGKMIVEDDKAKGTTKTVTVTASAIAGMEFASVRMWESDDFVREGEAFYFDAAFAVDKQKYVQRLYLFKAAYSDGVSVGDLLFDRSKGAWIEGHALQNAWGVKTFGGVLPKFGTKGVAVNCSDSEYEYTFTLKNKGAIAVTAKSRTTGKNATGTGQLRAESYDGGAVQCWTSLKVGNIMMAVGFMIPVDQDGNVTAGGIEILDVDYE